MVIDAGHGGKDPGCLGAGSKEKDICLAIALNLGRSITAAYEDVEVIYTRKTDIFLELHERASIANKSNADLFICIHANAGPKSAFGCETYVMGNNKLDANMQVAKRENSAILLEDNYETVYEGFNPNSDESYIIFSLMQNEFMDQSMRFADKLQRQFAKVGRKSRGVKQAGFLVLYKTAMPSVLIETGFLTNKTEEAWLKDTANQQKMAVAMFSAFNGYKSEVENNLGLGNPSVPKKDEPKTVKVGTKKRKNTKNPPLYPESNANATAGLVLRVQLTASSRQIAIDPDNFKGLKDIIEYKDGSIYKYVVGSERDMEGAIELQSRIRKRGYKDAFVVAFQGGKRIPNSKARELLKRGKKGN